MTASTPPAARGNRLLTAVAIALAALGFIKLTSAHAGTGPPQPAAAVQGAMPRVPTASAAPASRPPAALGYAVPTRIDIPAIHIHANMIKVGAEADGTLGTPPLSDAKLAGWYDLGPAPGQNGAAIIDAHVDSALMKDYRGAFFYLGEAKPGMQIQITRADGTVAVFTIDEIQLAPKTAFPTGKVYAPTTYPALRLITCGGAFDYKTHEYLANTIVYAHLTGEHPTA